MCIYIAVIGKRFGNAGFRNIVVELNILGESSVDQMLKGKHYNNTIRVLKYLYDEIKRHSIESYEQCLKESSDTTDDGYAALIESAEMQNVVHSPGKDTLEAMYEAHSEVIHKIQDFEILLLNGSFGPTNGSFGPMPLGIVFTIGPNFV